MRLEEMKNTPWDVFICYRGSNQLSTAVSGEIYATLTYDKKKKVFFAPRVYEKDQDFEQYLPDILSRVKVVVLMLSKGFFKGCSNADDVVRKELEEALRHPQIMFVPIQFEGFDWSVDGLDWSHPQMNRFKHITGLPYTDIYTFQFDRIINIINTDVECPSIVPLAKNMYRAFHGNGSEGVAISENSRVFEQNATKFAIDLMDDTRSIKDLKTILSGEQLSYSALQTVLGSEEDISISTLSFYAYYCLHVIYRRRKDFIDLTKLTKDYHNVFAKDHPEVMNHLFGIYCIEGGFKQALQTGRDIGMVGQNESYSQLMAVTHGITSAYPEHAGYTHLFADMFATIWETASMSAEEREAFRSAWHTEAVKAATLAIDQEQYAKFYCTKARIHSANHEYEEAENMINEAISREDSGKKDYILRLNNYQYHKTMIKMDQKLYQLRFS